MPITKNKIVKDYQDKFIKIHGKEYIYGNRVQQYETLVKLIKSYISNEWVESKKKDEGYKKTYYFYLDRLAINILMNNIRVLGYREVFENALSDLKMRLEDFEDLEIVCDKSFKEFSFLSNELSSYYCGIRLNTEFILNKKGKSLKENPWEIAKYDKCEEINFYGKINISNECDVLTFTHKNYETIIAIPYDLPIVSNEGKRISTLRLWSARAKEELDYSLFSKGDYINALYNKTISDEINCVINSNCESYEEKVLKLKQTYFLVSANLKSIIKEFKKNNKNISELYTSISIRVVNWELYLVVPELLRVLIDEEKLSWEEAWEITVKTIGYEINSNINYGDSNIIEILLPRIFMIINEINKRYCR